jgi:hypothetical protein
VATRWYRAPELCGSFSSKACKYELFFLLTEFIIAFMIEKNKIKLIVGMCYF